jgi:hypothetical protein
MKILLPLTALCFFATISRGQEKLFVKPGMIGCTFLSSGKNEYFILEPGYQLILEGKEGKQPARLVILVTKETKKIGDVETRVVTETETVNGKTVEISRNYFAICKETNDVYYFGEDVDMYRNGKVVNHEGSWLAEGKNHPGIAMPGKTVLRYKYYQEVAPDVALDKGEIVSTTEVLNTPAGKFINCLKIEETTDMNPKEKEYKIYASGIGLLKDDELLLVKYGFVK